MEFFEGPQSLTQALQRVQSSNGHQPFGPIPVQGKDAFRAPGVRAEIPGAGIHATRASENSDERFPTREHLATQKSQHLLLLEALVDMMDPLWGFDPLVGSRDDPRICFRLASCFSLPPDVQSACRPLLLAILPLLKPGVLQLVRACVPL